jgi:SET domain-containing protein
MTDMPSNIATRRSRIHGNGVFATAPIAKGARIIQYRGKLRSHGEVDRIYADEVETGHTFLFTLNDTYVIDANVQGNAARWINHSCAPNCEAVHDEDDDGDPARDAVYIEAMRAIKPGEELTYNYGITLGEPHTDRLKALWACRCGSPKCTGTMLQPKRKPKPAKKAAKTSAAKKAATKQPAAKKKGAKASPGTKASARKARPPVRPPAR